MKKVILILTLICSYFIVINSTVSALSFDSRVMQDLGVPDNCTLISQTDEVLLDENDTWGVTVRKFEITGTFSCKATSGETKTCTVAVSEQELVEGGSAIVWDSGCAELFNAMQTESGDKIATFCVNVGGTGPEGHGIIYTATDPQDESTWKEEAKLEGACGNGGIDPNRTYYLTKEEVSSFVTQAKETTQKNLGDDTMRDVACSSILPNWCDEDDGQGLVKILGWILNIVTAGVGILATIGIVVSAIQYISATGDSAKLAKAKSRIFNIVIGLLAYGVMWVALEWLIPGGIM